MKKILLVVILALSVFLLSSCERYSSINDVPGKNEPDNQSMFMLLEKGYGYKILVDRDTNVMYSMSFGGHAYGVFTLLVDADGNPKIWREAKPYE